MARARLIGEFHGPLTEHYTYHKPHGHWDRVWQRWVDEGVEVQQFQYLKNVKEWWVHVHQQRKNGDCDSFVTYGPFATYKQARRRLH